MGALTTTGEDGRKIAEPVNPDALRKEADDAWERGDWRGAANLMLMAERADVAKAHAKIASDRRALVDFAIDNRGVLSAAQIANVLGVSRNTVCGIWFRANHAQDTLHSPSSRG